MNAIATGNRRNSRHPALSALLALLLVLTMLPLAAVTQAQAATGDTFTAENADGVPITYKVLTEDGASGTVQLGTGAQSGTAIVTSFSGSLTIPETVTYDGVTYTVESIGDNAFWGCRTLTAVTIPDSVTNIGTEAFSNCGSLASATIPDSVTSMASYAFYNCGSLASVTIPDSVTSIERNTFTYCTSLVSVTIPDSVTSIGVSAFGNCTTLASVTISDSVTSIEGSAFNNCTALVSITIPDSVTSIGSNVFYGCTSLASVTVSDSMANIERRAFAYCAKLSTLTFRGTSIPKFGGDVFVGLPSAGIVYYPEGSEVSYLTGFMDAALGLPSGWQFVAVSFPSGPVAITGTTTITEGGEYLLDAALTGADITIETTEPVILIGNGVGDGSAATTGDNPANTQVSIIGFTDGIDLTLRDVKIINTSTGKNVINFTGGANSLTIEGENLLELEEGGGGAKALVRVPATATLSVAGTGTLYFYKSSQGAGFGSDRGEKNGDMTFSELTLFGKSTKPGPAIGSGAAYSGAPGNITFDSGEYTLIANAMGACIGGGSGGGGGTPANPGGNVYINGGTFSINVDWAGAAIGGGGYSGGNDAVGGNLLVSGGSLRTVCDENALPNWGGYGITDYGVTDKVITATKLNGDGSEAVYPLAFDTTLLAAPADSFTVFEGQTELYSGGGHHYKFVNEERNRDEGTYEEITTTPSNWVELDEPNLYLFLTGTDHELTVNGETFTYAFDEETSTFSLVLEPEPEPTYDTAWYNTTDTSFEIGTAAGLAGLAAIVNGTAAGIAQDSFEGRTVTLVADIVLEDVWTPIGTAVPASITYKGQVDISSVTEDSIPFSGTFDGAGHTVSGISISGETGGEGFFAYVGAAGTVRDLTIAGAISDTIEPPGGEHPPGTDYVGGLVAYNRGYLTGITNHVTVSAPAVYNVAGIAGFNDGRDNPNAVIEDCANLATITGQQKVGGIAGQNAGIIRDSYNAAKVDGTNASSKNGVGGIAGRNGNNNTAVETGIIVNCYNTAEVGRSGQKWVGGLVGFQNSLSSVTNSYMVGTVVKGAGYNNPLVGLNESSRDANNYSLEGINATGSSLGERGVVKTAEEMKGAAFVLALGEAYNLDTDSINDGYPVLDWQGGTAPAPIPEVGEPGSGDVDGDGAVTALDIVTLTRSVVGSLAELDDDQVAALDMDDDGVLTMADAIMLLRKAVGL